MVELISTLGLVTEKLWRVDQVSPFSLTCYLTQRDAANLIKNFIGDKDIKAVLQRLDRHARRRSDYRNSDPRGHLGLVQNMGEFMDGEQTHSACMPPSIEYSYL